MPSNRPARTAASRAALVVLLQGVGPAAAWWDGKNGLDPYTQAMQESRHANLDKDMLQKDPDFFKRMFGKLATEQAQAKHMDETQNVSPEDKCMTCHGVVVEFEKILAEHKERTGEKRSAVTVATALEGVCDLNRMQYLDPINPTKGEERSRVYGGIHPAIYVNACRLVLQAWDDNEEEIIEDALLKGGGWAGAMYAALRARACDAPEVGLCKGLEGQVVADNDRLQYKGKEAQCDDPNAKKKKKKKKKKVDPITQEPEYSID